MQIPSSDTPPREALAELDRAARDYFLRTESLVGSPPEGPIRRLNIPSYREHYWEQLSPELREEAQRLAEQLLSIAGKIVPLVKSAPLASEGDQQDLKEGIKAMRAALFLRVYRCWDGSLLHDEGLVYGFQPAGQAEDEPQHPQDAYKRFNYWKLKIDAVLDLVGASGNLSFAREGYAAAASQYRPGTAFIMMSMDQIEA